MSMKEAADHYVDLVEVLYNSVLRQGGVGSVYHSDDKERTPNKDSGGGGFGVSVSTMEVSEEALLKEAKFVEDESIWFFAQEGDISRV